MKTKVKAAINPTLKASCLITTVVVWGYYFWWLYA